MPPKSLLLRGGQKARVGRRDMLLGLAAATLLWPMNPGGAAEAVSIGRNPLFLIPISACCRCSKRTLQSESCDRSAHKAGTYQEITALVAFRAARRGVDLR